MQFIGLFALLNNYFLPKLAFTRSWLKTEVSLILTQPELIKCSTTITMLQKKNKLKCYLSWLRTLYSRTHTQLHVIYSGQVLVRCVVRLRQAPLWKSLHRTGSCTHTVDSNAMSSAQPETKHVVSRRLQETSDWFVGRHRQLQLNFWRHDPCTADGPTVSTFS